MAWGIFLLCHHLRNMSISRLVYGVLPFPPACLASTIARSEIIPEDW